jgi:UDP-N-acetyl-2-amino-2-deoxyglucuronate dehydrogenase
MKLRRNRIGIGIVGTGVIAQEHAKAINTLSDRAVLIAACDENKARLLRFGEAYFFPYKFLNVHDLLLCPEVDLVIVATPPASHEAIVISALDAGKYVICEKPVAHTLESADRIIQHTKDKLGRLSVSYQLRFSVDFQRLKWLLNHNGFNSKKTISCRRVTPINPSIVRRGWWGKWDVAGGGAVMTQFIHQLDLLCAINPQPTWVEAKASSHIPLLESEDTCEFQIAFSDDSVATCYCSVHEGPIENSCNISWDFGNISIPWQTGLTKNKDLAIEAESRFPTPSPSRPSTLTKLARKLLRKLGYSHLIPKKEGNCTHTPYLASVLDAIETEQPLPLSIQEARKSLELATAIYLAASTQKRVYLPLTALGPGYSGWAQEHFFRTKV